MGTDRIARTTPFREKGKCRWCNAKLPKGRRSWCCDDHSNEWAIRTRPAFAAALVDRRDKGICARCRADTRKQHKAYHRLLAYAQKAAGQDWYSTRPVWQAVRALAMKKYGIPLGRVETVWRDVNHIIPVVEGGGGCGLEGLETLCIPCHQKDTAAIAARLAETRKHGYLEPEHDEPELFDPEPRIHAGHG